MRERERERLTIIIRSLMIYWSSCNRPRWWWSVGC
ncbi:unnamed protein product [Musa hybrid cultivar]